jgi:PKD repeat protein
MFKQLTVILIIAFLVLFFSEYSYNSSGNPPDRYTGAPGDFGNCSSCHGGGGNPNNNGSNILQFNFNSNNQVYQPGITYPITITNTNATLLRKGFQTTVLNSSNTFVGSFAVVNTNTTGTVNANNRTYIEHRTATNAVNSWTFNWTAPAQSAGDLTFYVSSVAGNGSGSSGDIVYVDTFIIRESAVIPAPVSNFSANKTTACVNETLTFTSSATGDINSYNWNFGTGATPASATGIGPHQVSYSAAGNKNVSLTVNGPGGSVTETKTNYVTVNSLPAASAGNNAIICNGSNTQLNATGGVSYAWNNGSSLSATNIANPVASPTTTTTYTVTITNSNNCSATSQVTVNVNNLPIANAGNNATICNGSNTQLNATGGVSYAWNNGSSLSATNIANPTASPTTTTTYTVTVTNSNNCSATSQVTVNVNSLPTADAGSGTTICAGGTAQLNASGGISYQWNNGSSLSSTNIANPTATPTTTTTYTVTVTDANNCSATSTVTINISNNLTVSINNDTSICEGSSIQLVAGGGNTFSWSPAVSLDNENISNPTATPSVGVNTYTVNVSDGICTGFASVTITVDEAINPTVTNDTTLVINTTPTTLPLNASGGDSYVWTPADGLSDANIANPVFSTPDLNITNDTTITYEVTITKGACIVVETVDITLNSVVGEATKLNNHTFQLYPNPVDNTINIYSSYNFNNLEVYNISGQKQQIIYTEGANTIDISNLTSGLYYFRFLGEDKIENRTILVK